MKAVLLIATAVALLSPTNAPALDPQTRPAKPNFVVILADDLGYGDVQSYNPQRGKIPTPHLDKLAAQGMRFTDGHSSSGVCSPSRYTLLTGRYHWRTRLQSGIVGTWGPPLIAPERMTIGTLAKQHGYRTAAVGKWHLGWDWPITPAQRSHFTAAAGAKNVTPPTTAAQSDAWRNVFSQRIPGGPTTRGFDSYFGTDVPNWPPFCFIENDRTVGVPSEWLPAAKFVKNQASVPGPALAGWELEPILPAVGDRACAFIAESAARPEPFLLYLPLTTPHTPLAVNREWKGRSGLSNDCADLIMETDAVIGRVLTALEKSGKADDTLVFFSSDNGFAAYAGAKDLEQRGHFPSGPLRGYKTEVFEGGHREPFIIRWPRLVKPGGVSGQLVHQADLLATFAHILGAKLPADAGEDSFSLLPLLRGEDQPVREHAVSCASSGVPGVREGPWKLVLMPEVQLYHLGNDLGETKNLAAEQPERIARMKSLYAKLIADGRSTPGAPQKNDVEVDQHPRSATGKKKGVTKKQPAP